MLGDENVLEPKRLRCTGRGASCNVSNIACSDIVLEELHHISMALDDRLWQGGNRGQGA